MRWMAAGFLIGIACYTLRPEQPYAMIATVVICAALGVLLGTNQS